MLAVSPESSAVWARTSEDELTSKEFEEVTGVDVLYQTLLVATSFVVQMMLVVLAVVLVAVTPEITGVVVSTGGGVGVGAGGMVVPMPSFFIMP